MRYLLDFSESPARCSEKQRRFVVTMVGLCGTPIMFTSTKHDHYHTHRFVYVDDRFDVNAMTLRVKIMNKDITNRDRFEMFEQFAWMKASR
jgi:hypothetical protein